MWRWGWGVRRLPVGQSVGCTYLAAFFGGPLDGDCQFVPNAHTFVGDFHAPPFDTHHTYRCVYRLVDTVLPDPELDVAFITRCYMLSEVTPID